MDIRKILQDAEVGPVDAVLFVLLFLAFGYISYLIFLEFSDRLKPKAAAPSSKVGSSKRAPRSREQLLKPIEKKIGVKEMSLEELADASKEGAGLLGCKGRVFDVSSNEMYAPDGAYHLFVGKDASVALSKMKFNKEFLDPSQLHWARDLDEKELNILEDWVDRFEGKYELVAYIKDDLKLKK